MRLEGTMTQARPLRADAVRNRKKILDAAHLLITRHGPEVPMDAIAEAAGVAVGTLYRHYPTKTDLVGAVLSRHVERMTLAVEEAADRVRVGEHAMTELTALVSRVIEAAAQDHAVKAAAQGVGASYAPENDTRAAAALTELITAGQADGDLHADVTVADFYLLLATAPLEQPREVRERWLTLILPGFTAGAR
jgi:AcrR family transcriptional regulator